MPLLLAVLTSVGAWAQDYTENNVNYYIDGSTAYVGASASATGAITILDKITVAATDYAVTEIQGDAFRSNTSITSVSLPSSLLEIGSNAFRGCTGLATLDIPNSVTTLYSSAFRECSGLITITIGTGVTKIEADVFFQCANVTDVYMNADCAALTWNEADHDDFKYDGTTVCHVTDAAPWKAKFGTVVNVIFRDASSVPFSYSYNDGTHTLTLSGNESMPNYDFNTTPWYSYRDEITTVVIEDGVPNIGSFAFYECSGVTSLTIPSSVTYLANSAFQNSGLTSLTIPNTVTSIGNSIFRDCSALTTVTIGSGITSGLMGDQFYGCTNLTTLAVDEGSTTYKAVDGMLLSKDGTKFICCPQTKTSVTIPASVTSINTYAFYKVNGLTTITVPDNVTVINNEAFYYCTGLTTVSIGNGLSALYGSSFDYCSSLTTVNFGTGLTSFNGAAFKDCNNLSTVTIAPENTSLKTSNNLILSKDGTIFYWCPRAISSLVIPNTVTEIESEAARYCINLTALVIPQSVTTIQPRAFRDCTGLTTITIGSGVTSIGKDAFFRTTATENVYCYANPAALTWDDADYDDFKDDGSTRIHVAAADLTAFQTKWSTGDASKDVHALFVGDLAPAVAGNNVEGIYWSSYYNSAVNMKADANTIVYKAAISGSSLVLSEIADKVINAGEAVILKSTSSSTTLTPQAAASAGDYTGNVLEGVDVATAKQAGYEYYVLSNASGLGFYHYTGSTLGANKAFVKVSSAPAHGFFDLDESTTGIRSIASEQQSSANQYYNLNGQRVNVNHKGLYIVNGKKVIIK